MNSLRSRSRGRWLLVLIAVVALAWSLPRPSLQDAVVGHTEHAGDKSSSDSSNETTGRLAFRSARRLSELAAKGPLADETELSGPCLADAGQSLYFARSRPGQRADIMLARRDGERWSRAEPVRELNSVDDDRRVTIDAKGQSLLLASNRSGTRGGFDLYESSRVRDHWTKPKSIGESLNTADDEFDPSLSGDGLTLYFVRKTAGESADIFESHRAAIDAAWSVPQAIAAVNSAESHERSPAISPDGKFLYFASNRAVRSGDESQFDLFRAPLQNGVVGTPIRVQDGIASAADDVDAAFAADARTLVFASKREGPKQLYLSHADFVATRLSWNTEHLAPLGRAKWGVPILSGLFLLWAVRRTRRSAIAAAVTSAEKSKVAEPPKIVKAEKPLPPKRMVEPTTAPERRVETIDQPKQRSTASKNPLTDWPTGSSSSSPAVSSSKAISSTKKSATQTSERTAIPAGTKPISASSSEAELWTGRRIFKTTVAVALTAAWLIAFKPNWPMPEGPTSFDHEALTSLTQFRDITAARQAEQKPLARVATARTIAPGTSEPMDLTALRQAARWPSTLMTVRSKAAVDRVAEELPDLVRMVKQLVVARQSISGSSLRPREAVADEANLIAGSIAPDKVIGAASTPFAKQLVDLSPQQRTLLQPAVVTSSMLRLPQSPATSVAAAAVVAELKTVQIAAMPRNGVPSRVISAAEIAQAELSVPLSVVAQSEPALSPKLLVMNRGAVTEASSAPVLGPVPVKQISAISNVVARPSVVSDAVRDLAEVGVNKNTNTTPIARQAAEPKLSPIVVEPVTQSSSTTSNGGPALLLTSATQLAELLPPSILSAMTKLQAVGPAPTLAAMADSGPTKWQSRISTSRTSIEPREPRVESTSPSIGSTITFPRQTKESLAAGIIEEVKPIDP